MKPRFYVYLVVLVILIIIISVMTNAKPADVSQNVISLKPAVTKPAAATATTAKPVAKPAATAPVKPADRYYSVHVSPDGPAVYYSTTTAVDMIKVSNPPRDTNIASPLTVTGMARGSWFFEASAPVFLTDAKGKILAEGVIKAQNNWMTSEYVPFIGTLAYPPQQTGSLGVLVVKNDNPSGLPQRDMAVEILVRFK